ncbi:MAG TPA: hypothetical protein VK897_09910 [Anaerolineales bacterium]|nr:hypothetical protein [Anaerolineales bacterium]
MKKKLSKLRLPYFFGQRNPGTVSSGNMPELIKPEAELQRVEIGIEDILRWADDGGRMLDLGPLIARAKPDTDRERTGE